MAVIVKTSMMGHLLAVNVLNGRTSTLYTLETKQKDKNMMCV